MQLTRELFADTWMPMTMRPPEAFETYDVTLSDGSVQRAFWSGKAWWLQGKVVDATAWRVSADTAAAA